MLIFINIIFPFRPVGFDENCAVQQAINNSLKQHDDTTEEIVVEETGVTPHAVTNENYMSLIKEYAATKVSGDPRNIVVSRLSMWQTAHPYFKRKGFLKGTGMLQVTFATFESEEDAVDLGGPRREFFHLLLGAISNDSGTLLSKLYQPRYTCNLF